MPILICISKDSYLWALGIFSYQIITNENASAPNTKDNCAKETMSGPEILESCKHNT